MRSTHHAIRATLLRSSAVVAFIAVIASGCAEDFPTQPQLSESSLKLSAPADNFSLASLTPDEPVVLVGAGSLGRCGEGGVDETAELIDQTPGTVFTTGDNAYPNGSLTNYNNCYEPNWGRNRGRTRPAAGDQDYKTAGASGYFSYYGNNAGEAGKGYYSYNTGAWHVVVLNDNLSLAEGSPQHNWLKSDLLLNRRVCSIAYWHRPRFSSYGTTMRDDLKPAWDVLYENGVDVVVNGHYRVYERFARLHPDGERDNDYGIRQFTVGTGGSGSDSFYGQSSASEAQGSRVHGVLKLSLSSTSYAWEFVPIPGESFRDSGTAQCHNAPGSGPVLSSVEVSPATVSIIQGKTSQLTSLTKDALGSILANLPVDWRSEDTTKVKVSTLGVITGIAVGATYVVATSGLFSDTSAVTVLPIPVASVAVSSAATTLEVGQTTQLSAVTRDENGIALIGRTVTWSSSNNAIATVSSSGLATAVSAGNVTFTGTSEGVSANVSVAVNAPAIDEITTGGIRPGYYVSPSGSSGNNGSYNNPWTLAYALSGAGGRVQPGDTVWMRGGTYRGSFRSTVSGAAGRPVVIRQFPGERAVIDGNGTASGTSVFYVGGQHTVFWGFEITNSNTMRITSSTANNVRNNVVSNYASNNTYLNLVVHDGGVAFYNEPSASNVQVIGCIFYNNGWQGPDRGHGHGIYIKSYNGPVVVRDNIIFNQFGYGVHAYTNAGSGKLNNIRFDGNVSFNNGTLSTTGASSNFLLGGDDTATGDEVVNNFTYMSPGISVTNVKIGYSTTRNGSVSVANNYFVGGSTVLEMGYWSSATVSSNMILGSSTMVRLNDSDRSGKSWSNNEHYRDPNSTSWRFGSSSYNFSNWTSTSGYTGSDQARSGTPTSTRVFVRPNINEHGRANIIVYNWGRLGSVSADLGGIVPVGATYEIRNVQDLYGSPVVSGRYSGGSVSIPIVSVAPPTPVGYASRSPRTGPDFDVFVVTIR